MYTEIQKINLNLGGSENEIKNVKTFCERSK